jgi:hypothetical protein
MARAPGAAIVKLADRLEHTTEQDQYFSYCWWPYEPVAPTEGKFRPANLLYQSFDLAGAEPRAFDFVRTIQETIGPFRTVWGVKLLGERLAWEFYFYDYKRQQRDVSIGRVLDAIRPYASSSVHANENLEYFMFSIDVDDELVTGRRELDVVHMYIGNPGSTVSSGIAYALTDQGSTLENFYFFFDGARDLASAADKIRCSAHVDAGQVPIQRILVPELRECHTICVANKRTHDTVYFSGVNVDQLLFFFRMLNYPTAITEFVTRHRHKLDHLLYDVGFDYRARGKELEFLKSGYYGVF